MNRNRDFYNTYTTCDDISIIRVILFYIQINKYGPIPAGKHRKSLEPESSIPAGSCRNAQEVDRNPPEKSGQFPGGILLPVPGISGVFLQDPVAGIFNLGSNY
jgi:hypothetical protein